MSEMSVSCHRHSHGDSCSDPVAQDAQALMQPTHAAAEDEAEAMSHEAAGTAGPEPGTHEAAVDPFNDSTTSDSIAIAAASAHLEYADTTGAASAEPVSLAVGTRQTSIQSSPPSIAKVQSTRVAGDMQASAADTSRTQVPMVMKQAICAAPHSLSSATVTHNAEPASKKAGESVTGFVGNRVKQMEPGRVDNTAVKQSRNAVRHDRSLNANVFSAPKAVRNQTIPSMFQKKRKAQIMELAPQLHRAEKPCVEVIDLVSDDEPITPAASDTPSRHEFGSGHDQAEVIEIDGDLQGAVNVSEGALSHPQTC